MAFTEGSHPGGHGERHPIYGSHDIAPNLTRSSLKVRRGIKGAE